MAAPLNPTTRGYAVFTVPATYSIPIPEGSRVLCYDVYGGSSGGGGGRRGAAGSARIGGGGGAPGAISRGMIALDFLGLVPGDVLQIRVGSGSNGGAGAVADNTDGSPSGAGSPSWIRDTVNNQYLAYALGGGSAQGGVATGSSGGSVPAVSTLPTALGGNSALSGTSSSGAGNAEGGGGGGGGGGISTANALINPGPGGVGRRGRDPTVSSSVTPPYLGLIPGNGGRGGTANTAPTGEDGGLNAGGGGGAGSTNGSPAGNGGKGGAGPVYLLFL